MHYKMFDQELLNILNKIPTKPFVDQGFLEISGLEADELTNTQLYAYFLNQKINPQVAEIFIESLLEIIDTRIPNKQLLFQNYFCKLEQTIEERKRIDLVIETCRQKVNSAIVIENKLYSNDTNNDFNAYYDAIKIPDDNKIGILLTLMPKKPRCEKFINITHIEWISKIKSRGIPVGLPFKTYLYLNDFISTISNLTMSTEYDDQSRFFFEHTAAIKSAAQTSVTARNFILNQLKVAASQLDCSLEEYHDFYRSFYINNSDIFYGIYFRDLFDNDQPIRTLCIAIGVQRLNPDIKKKLESLQAINSYFQANAIENTDAYIIYQTKNFDIEIENISKLATKIVTIINEEFSDIRLLITDKIQNN